MSQSERFLEGRKKRIRVTRNAERRGMKSGKKAAKKQQKQVSLVFVDTCRSLSGSITKGAQCLLVIRSFCTGS